MRIIFDVLRDGMASINTASRELAETQRQVASGKRIQGAGDDALGAQQAVAEHATIGAIDAYSRTGSSASARLAAIDNVLASLGNKLTAAHVAAVSTQGSNVTPETRSAAAAELRSLRDAIVADVNTRFQGAALFSGAAVDQAAYAQVGGAWTYQGDGATVQVEVDRGRRVAITLDGRSILQGNDAADVLTALDDLATAIEAGDTSAVTAGIAAIERAFTRTQRAVGALGADQRSVDESAVRLGALRVAASVRRSTLEDVNLAEAATRMTRAETAYKAALAAVSTAERQSLLDYLR